MLNGDWGAPQPRETGTALHNALCKPGGKVKWREMCLSRFPDTPTASHKLRSLCDALFRKRVTAPALLLRSKRCGERCRSDCTIKGYRSRILKRAALGGIYAIC